MVNLNPTFTLIIIVGVLQVCTANPFSVEGDATKIFTADELERARNAGISSDALLIRWNSEGYTLDEMIQIYPLARSFTSNVPTFNHVTKICEILDQNHKTATNYSNAHEIRLNELHETFYGIPHNLSANYFRTSICSYLSEPFVHEMDASSFGLQLIPYMKFRFWKLENQNATGVERVTTAKQLCCIYNGRYNISQFKVPSASLSLSQEKMNDFTEHWNDFETTKTSKSFLKVCDFLRSTDTSEEC